MINNQKLSFEFDEKNTILIEFDPKNKILSFKKEGKNETFQFEINIDKLGYKINICAIL